MYKLLLLSIAVLLSVPNFINVDINKSSEYNSKEKFNPALSFINSINRLEEYADSSAKTVNINQNSIEYYVLLKNIVSDRFYHGFSHYTLSQNWLAAISQKIFGYGLDTKVIPDDIMQNPMAGCSQQSEVMMAVAEKKSVSYRSVNFPHHYALELNLDKTWYFFDPDMEPSLSINDRKHQNWNSEDDNLKKFYTSGTHTNVDFELGIKTKATFGMINGNPAPRLKIFLIITYYLSRLLWIIPMLILSALSKNIFSVNFKKERLPAMLPA